MGIEANVIFKANLKEKLQGTLTLTNLYLVLDAVNDLLGDYELTRNVIRESGKDYMVQAYLDAIRVEGKSPKTIKHYEGLIRRLLTTIGVGTKDVTVYHIRNFLSDEKARGLADATINNYRNVFCAYFGWLFREGLIARNPMNNITQIKCRKTIYAAFSPVEIEELKAGCESIRDKAIVCFLTATGCRISEMVGLNRNDIDIRNRECKVLGKGNKERTIYLDDVACDVLKQYLVGRGDGGAALFVGKGGERLQAGGVRIMLKRLEKRTKVHRVHPHKFRRTFATNMIKRGMTIQEVAAILGHEKIDTTMRYIVLDKSQIKSSYQRYV